MLPADSLIDELPPAGRLLLGGVCCLGSALLGFAAWHAGDPLLIVLALGCGVPLGLLGLALLLGPARAERGRARRAVGADGGGTDGAGLAASVKALLLGIGLALGLAPCPLAAAPVLEPARSLLEQPYGEHPAQRFDVYLPARAERAPILLIVHGGGWAQGDKAARGLMRNKLKRWLPRDLILVSSNYRLLDQGGDPHSQAEDLARALAEVQRQAAAWGGDPQRVVLIGHSAGAHLVSLLASDPRLAAAAGARPWLGSIALDSAAFDVEAIMRGSPLRLYQRAFGNDPAYWRAVSPLHQLTAAPAPLLAVCSSRRADACRQAQAFQGKAQQLGGRVERLEVDLSHGQIDRRLGLPGGYTEAVERFLGSLDGELAQRLSR